MVKKPVNADPLGKATIDEPKRDLEDMREADMRLKELTPRERDELKAMLSAKDTLQSLVETIMSMDSRLRGIENQTAMITENRKYGDYIKLAIDTLGLTEVAEDVRYKREGTPEKAVMQWNALVHRLQEDRRSLNDSLFDGNVDKYHTLEAEFEKTGRETGDPMVLEYFELRKILDKKHAIQYEIGDLTMMLALLLVRQLNLLQPQALMDELHDLAKKHGDEFTTYVA